MISIVCVYTDAKLLEDCLLAGLKGQTAAFELIAVPNTAGEYASAAAALNHGGAKANGEYIAFIHQDVRLMSRDWLARAEAWMEKLPVLGAAGPAGMRRTKTSGFLPVGTTPADSRRWAVCHGSEATPAVSAGFETPVEVQTLDEQLIIVPRRVFERLRFDEDTCDGWHLYGVDYSLSVAKAGLKAYALPLKVCHLSGGKADGGYYRALTKVLNKHSGEKVIYTTCGLWRTSLLRNVMDLLVLAARSELGRWAGRNTHGAAPTLRRLRMLLGPGRR